MNVKVNVQMFWINPTAVKGQWRTTQTLHLQSGDAAMIFYFTKWASSENSLNEKSTQGYLFTFIKTEGSNKFDYLMPLNQEYMLEKTQAHVWICTFCR